MIRLLRVNFGNLFYSINGVTSFTSLACCTAEILIKRFFLLLFLKISRELLIHFLTLWILLLVIHVMLLDYFFWSSSFFGHVDTNYEFRFWYSSKSIIFFILLFILTLWFLLLCWLFILLLTVFNFISNLFKTSPCSSSITYFFIDWLLFRL